jgi:amino acid transporter
MDEILPQSTPHDTQHSLRRRCRSGHLLRILGVGFGLAVGIGNTIGTGILRTPGEVAGYLGNRWLLGSVISDLKHSLFTAILILVSYIASILIIREKSEHG